MRTLEITTKVSKCLGCSFCPQDKLNDAYNGVPFLSYEAFQNALLKVPKDVQIHFSGFAEPFLNPDCGRMIAHALYRGFEVHIYTTLMGLNNRQMEALIGVCPQFIRLHVPDGKFLKLSNENWLRQFNLFLNWERPFTAMAMGEIDPELKRILTDRGIKVELPDMLSRGGNLWKPNPSGRKFKACSMNRWHNNVMLPNGDVYSDCHDYSLTIKLGNIFADDYQAIYDAAEKWKVSDHSSDICSQCEWASFA